MIEYSVEEVRDAAGRTIGLVSAMLTAYAERIKAGQGAAPFGYAYRYADGIKVGGDGRERNGMRPTEAIPLFTHPPAQAAQVDAWQIVCDSIRKHQFSDENRRGRLTIDVETLLREINIRKDAEPVAHHPDDAAIDAFADAMKAKLAEARAKGRGGWQDKADCPQQRLSDMLRAHIEKGDPCDVANFCMFLHQRGESILPAEPVAQPTTNSPGTASKLVGEAVVRGEDTWCSDYPICSQAICQCDPNNHLDANAYSIAAGVMGTCPKGPTDESLRRAIRAYLAAQPAQSVDVEKVREVIADLREYGDEALADKLNAALQEKGNG